MQTTHASSRPGGTSVVLLWLAAAAAAAYLAGADATGTARVAPALLAGLVAAAVAIPVVWGRFSLLEALIIGCPVMFFSSVTGPLHVSAADAALPFLLWGALAQAGHGREPRSALRAVAAFAAYTTAFVAASAVAATAGSGGFTVSLGVENCLKLGVGLVYAAVVAAHIAKADGDTIVRALRLWGVVAAALSAASVLTASGLVHLMRTDGVRSFGYFQDPNLYGGYLLTSLAVIFVAECLSSTRWTPLLIVVVAVGVISTASRAAFATLGIALFVALVLVSRRRVRVTALPLLLIFATLAYAVLDRAPGWLDVPGLGRLSTSAHSVRSDSRFELWSRAFHLWKDHPLFGIGIGQFGRYSSDILGTSPITGTGFVAHNTFLSFLAELGLFGFLLSAGGILALTYIVVRAGHLDRAVRGSLLVGLLVLSSEMMTLNLQNVRYVWIFAGVLLGLCRPVIVGESATTDAPSGQSTGRRH